jgi:hypothetical protein
MTFIRYQKYGKQEYAYEITAYWDPIKKVCRQKTKYLGVVIDKKKKIFEKRAQKSIMEKMILDFGDTYFLEKFLEDTRFIPLIKSVFGEDANTFLALLSYRLCHTGAMMYANNWYEGSYAKFQYSNAELKSQRISDFLKVIGEEALQRRFFHKYLSQFCNTKKGIIIDGTSLPNQISVPITDWGRSGEEIDEQIRFLLVVDKETSLPVFFRTVPGNIVDVSTITNTVDELKRYGVKETSIYFDAGFFSEDNIKELYKNKLQFLTRLPAGRTLYKELINTEIKDLESIPNFVKYGKRGLCIKQKEIDLFGKKGYAYIVLDPLRKGRELSRLIMERDGEGPTTDLEYDCLTRGIMILVSSSKFPKEDVVPAYYTRQTAEMLFGFSKDDLGILPLRVHSELAISGFLFMQFLILIAFAQLKNKLDKEYTVEEVLLTLRNLKCKVYEKEIVVSELTKQHKEICEKLGILVSKTLGI